jgi:hypothetical protein
MMGHLMVVLFTNYSKKIKSNKSLTNIYGEFISWIWDWSFYTLIGSLFDIESFHYIYFNLDNNKLIIPCCKSYYCFLSYSP